VHLGGAGQLVAARLQPDPAEQVQRDRHRDQAEHGDRHAEVDEVVQPGQLEDVEADVTVEVGVLGAERDLVAPQQELPPLSGARAAGEDREDHRDAEQQPAPHRLDHLAVAVEVDLLLRRRPEDRAEAVGDHDVGRDDRAEQHAEDQEQHHPGAEDGVEHLGVTDAAEPQPVGPDPGEDRGQEEGRDQDDGGADERA
jgi:hypothetical protein